MHDNYPWAVNRSALYYAMTTYGDRPSCRTVLLSSTAWSGGSRLAIGGLIGSLVMAPVSTAFALPVGGTVAAGTAVIAGTASEVTVKQSSQNAVINWQGFSIGKNEAVIRLHSTA
jgi:large exoprotein involved in heme utilization and adhesion